MTGRTQVGQYRGPAVAVSGAGDEYVVQADLVATQAYEDVAGMGGERERVFGLEEWHGTIDGKGPWTDLQLEMPTLRIGQRAGTVLLKRIHTATNLVEIVGSGDRPF
jgi:hypothetical protein